MAQPLSLVEGNVGKTLLKFSAPFLFASLLQAIYGSVDIFVVGMFAGSDSVSAISVGFQIMRLVLFVVFGLATGGCVLAGQYFGAGNKENAAKVVGNMISVFGIFSAVITAAMLLLNANLVSWMQTPAEAVEKARQYLYICSSGILFLVGYNVVVSVLRGLGDSKTPLYFVAMACVFNILFDFILVGGFHLEAAGAAVANVSSQALSFLFSLFYLKKLGFMLKMQKSDLRFDPRLVKKILSLGAPVSLQNGLITISFLIITAVTNTMGLVVSASVGVVEKILEFAMLISISFGMATGAITAQNIGANKPKRARESLRIGIGISLGVGILFCIMTQTFPRAIASLLSKDSDVIRTAALYLRSYSLDCLPLSFVMSMNAYFNGLGRTVFTMAHSIVTAFFVKIPIVYLAFKVGGTLFHIGFGSPAATLTSLVICIVYYRIINKKCDEREQGPMPEQVADILEAE